jgi:hypothetical protein
MSFVKIFNEKFKQKKKGRDRRERMWKNFRWTGHLRDAALIATGSMPLHRREKETQGKGLESMGSQHRNTKKIFSLCLFCFFFVSCLKISSFEPYPCQKRHLRLIILQQRKQQTSFPSIFFRRCRRSIEPISLDVPLRRLGIRSAPLVKVITSLASHLPRLYSHRL